MNGSGQAEDAAEPEPEAEAEPQEPVAEPVGPVIHVPDRELGAADGDGAAPVKRKTRRGSRGGRNRKRKPAAAAATADVPTEEAEADDWTYTPMSEWGLDEDK